MVSLNDGSTATVARVAYGASADGSVIVGGSGVAFLWTAADGVRALKDVLEDDYGLDLSGWGLTVATAVSPDGTVIVGYGTNPQGQEEAWRAVLPEQCAEALAMRSWLNPAGGPFAEPANWSAAAVPGSPDRARFGLGDADYTVTFVADHTNQSMLVRGGDRLRLALGGRAYVLTGGDGCGPSLDVRDAGAPVRLEVGGGQLIASGGAVLDGVLGTELVLAAGGTLNASALAVAPEHGGDVRVVSGGWLLAGTGPATIGGAVLGRLFVEAGGRATFTGPLHVAAAADGAGEVEVSGAGALLERAGGPSVG
jgi:hypothetical protein